MKDQSVKVIQAEKIIVGDPDGQHLELSADGVSIWRKPETGHPSPQYPAAALRLDKNGHARLTLHDGCQQRLAIGLQRKGAPEIALNDLAGRCRLQLKVTKESDTPRLALLDGKGEWRYRLELDEQSNAKEMFRADTDSDHPTCTYVNGYTQEDETDEAA